MRAGTTINQASASSTASATQNTNHSQYHPPNLINSICQETQLSKFIDLPWMFARYIGEPSNTLQKPTAKSNIQQVAQISPHGHNKPRTNSVSNNTGLENNAAQQRPLVK